VRDAERKGDAAEGQDKTGPLCSAEPLLRQQPYRAKGDEEGGGVHEERCPARVGPLQADEDQRELYREECAREEAPKQASVTPGECTAPCEPAPADDERAGAGGAQTHLQQRRKRRERHLCRDLVEPPAQAKHEQDGDGEGIEMGTVHWERVSLACLMVKSTVVRSSLMGQWQDVLE